MKQAKNPKSKKNTKIGTVIFFMVLILVNLFICNISFVFGNSMSPTLHDKQVVVCLKAYGEIERGDIVITTTKNPLKTHLIKRVVGLGGETVRIDGTSLFVNGILLGEPYAKWETGSAIAEFEVPENAVFLIGDNRSYSKDSREIGTIPLDEIQGKVLFVR